MSGVYPRIFESEKYGKEAKKLTLPGAIHAGDADQVTAMQVERLDLQRRPPRIAFDANATKRDDDLVRRGSGVQRVLRGSARLLEVGMSLFQPLILVCSDNWCRHGE